MEVARIITEAGLESPLPPGASSLVAVFCDDKDQDSLDAILFWRKLDSLDSWSSRRLAS